MEKQPFLEPRPIRSYFIGDLRSNALLCNENQVDLPFSFLFSVWMTNFWKGNEGRGKRFNKWTCRWFSRRVIFLLCPLEKFNRFSLPILLFNIAIRSPITYRGFTKSNKKLLLLFFSFSRHNIENGSEPPKLIRI